MRHRVVGKQLSRTSSHRKALMRNLAASLIEHGAIRTTEVKAREAQRFAERLITIARSGTLHARRRVIALLQDRLTVDEKGELTDKTVITRLFDEVAPRYADRQGGYTRIIHLSERRIGDGGRQVLLQLIEQEATAAQEAPKAVSRRKKRATKRHEAAAAAGATEADQGTQEPQPHTETAEQPARESPEHPEDEPQAEEADQAEPEDQKPG